jgi:hypothetical protein
MALGFWQTLATLQTPGTALTAAARASLTQGGAATGARFTLPGNALKTPGDMLRVYATGIISCVITTPGTARFDLSMATVAKLDTQAMPLNIVARTNVPWILDMTATLTAPGTAATWNFTGVWLSEAFILTAIQNVGPGPGGTLIPWSGSVTGASTAGTTFDSTVSNQLDLNFTQTVTTGSCTLQQLNISLLTATGF